MLQSPFVRGLLVALACAFLLARDFVTTGTAAREVPVALVSPARHAAPSEALPLTANVGQWSTGTIALARLGCVTAYLHPSGWTTAMRAESPSTRRRTESGTRQALWTSERYGVSRVTIVEARPDAAPEFEDPLPGAVSLASGYGAHDWHRDIPTYRITRVRAVRPGVDLEVATDASSLTWTFVHGERSDVANTRLFVQGAQRVRVTPTGRLEIRTAAGTQHYDAPTASRDGQALRCRFVMHGTFTVGFQITEPAASHSGPTVVRFALPGEPEVGDGNPSLLPWDDPRWPRVLDPSGQWVVAGLASPSTCPDLPADPDELVSLPTETFVARLSAANRKQRLATSVTYLHRPDAASFASVAIDGRGRAALRGCFDGTPDTETTLLCLDLSRPGAEALTFQHPALGTH
ncbi:MAG: hypothetical protein R3F56_18885 [Planctomycetota bacterium]